MTATLRPLATRYVRERSQRGELRPATRATYVQTLWLFVGAVGDVEPSRLTRRKIERWLAEGQWAPATRRQRLSIVRLFVRWMVDRGDLKRDPTIAIARVRGVRHLPRGLDTDQVEALLAVAGSARMTLILLLMVQEGLRRGEVARVEVGDVDMANRLLLVRGKGGHERVLPLSDETLEAMHTYLGERPARAGRLIRSEVPGCEHDGLSEPYITKLTHDVMVAAGVKRSPTDGVSAHALRHTMATDLLRNGAHIRNVQAALGHADLKSTQVYLPWVVGELRESMAGRRYRRGEKPTP